MIAADLPDIRALLDRFETDLPGTLAAIATGALALSRVQLRYLRECGIPNCKNLGGFGRLLQDLIGVVETGAILVLVAEAAQHPEATARTVNELVGGPVREAAHTFRELAGV